MNMNGDLRGKAVPGLTNAERCTHCGYCLPVCPTYLASNNEADSPRGRVSMMLALQAGALAPDEARDALQRCLLCRACHVACPSGVKPGRLVMTARSATFVKAPWSSRLLHFITDRPGLTSWAARGVALLRLLLPNNRRLRSLLGPLGRLLVLIPDGRPETPPPFPPARQERQKVALLCGCMGRLFYPHIAPSAAQLLDAAGFDVVAEQRFGCCGSPHREKGDRTAFVRQARRTLDAFANLEEVAAVVCDAGACAATAQSYPKVLEKDPAYAGKAKAFADKVVPLSDFLKREGFLANVSLSTEEQGGIVHHDHCQLRNGLGTITSPRDLLRGVAGAGWRELPRAERCCGAGGEYMLHQPHMSQTIRKDKIQAVMESKAQLLTAENPGCMLNLEAGLALKGSSVRVRHLAEVLWRAMRRPLS